LSANSETGKEGRHIRSYTLGVVVTPLRIYASLPWWVCTRASWWAYTTLGMWVGTPLRIHLPQCLKTEREKGGFCAEWSPLR